MHEVCAGDPHAELDVRSASDTQAGRTAAAASFMADPGQSGTVASEHSYDVAVFDVSEASPTSSARATDSPPRAGAHMR